MNDMPSALSLVLVFALAAYVLLDGFDLGVGMWLSAADDYEDRTQIINAIAPVWDGNETWLVLAGATLLGGFSLAYGILLPALYVPLILMLIALGMRGVSFEFRFQIGKNKLLWDRAFVAGSLLAALCQGAVAGALLHGIAVTDSRFSGESMDWLSPFSATMALTVACGYLIVGAGWLNIKTDGTIQRRVRKMVVFPLVALPILVLLLALCLPAEARNADIASGRSALHWYLRCIALVVYLAIWLTRRSDGERWTFGLGLTLFALGLLDFVTFVYPWIVPFAMTVKDASSPANSQTIIFVGALIVIPVIISYCLFAYHVFRGKAPREEF